MAEKQDDFRHIVRIAGVDLNGNRKVISELLKIKGVSFSFAKILCEISGTDGNQIAGHLKDENVAKMEEILSEPEKFKVPPWILNRRADPEKGTNFHLTGSELIFTNQTDVRNMQKIKSYKGLRHHFKLPLRGQRTKSNFRRNKGKVQSVKRKVVKQQKRK